MARTRRSRHHEILRSKTAQEHTMIVAAIHELERTFTARAVKRERSWQRRTRHHLAKVVGLLQEHCESAEAEDGLLPMAERHIGRFQEVSQARREHKRLVRDAALLLGDLDEFASAALLPYVELRKRAARLTASMRLHQAHEADLLMLAFQLDLGGGD